MKKLGVVVFVLALVVMVGSFAHAASSTVNVDVKFVPFCNVVTTDLALDLGTVNFAESQVDQYYASDYEYFVWKTNTKIVLDSITSSGFRLVGDNGQPGIGCTALDERVKIKFDIPQWTQGGWTNKRISFSRAKFQHTTDHTIEYPFNNPEGGNIRLGIAAEIRVFREDAHLIPAGTWRNEITITFAAPDVGK